MGIDPLLSRIASLLPGEYLFVIGSIYLGLLLRHRWVTAAFMFGLGALWLGFYASVASYLKGLSADSFVEAHTIDGPELRHVDDARPR